MLFPRSSTVGRTLSVVACLALYACDSAGEERARASRPTVRSHPRDPVAKTGAAVHPRSSGGAAAGYVGVLVAREAVDIASRVSGVLTAIHARIGDRVAKHAVLASLDDTSARHELRAARAKLKAELAKRVRAKVQLAEAKKRLKRRLPLKSRGVTAEELATTRLERDQARSDLALATAMVAVQRAGIVQLEQALAHHQIRAPFSGRVALRYLDRGAVVDRGRPILRLINSDGLTVRFAVPPPRAATISVGDALQFRVRGMKVQLDGSVSRIADEVDSATQMVIVEGALEKPGDRAAKIRAGQVGRVSLDERSGSSR